MCVDPQTIADEHLAEVAEALGEAVENEHLTQGQADAMLEKMAEQAANQLEAIWDDCGPAVFMGRGGAMGGFRRFPGGKGTDAAEL